jgi:hypothetical protein
MLKAVTSGKVQALAVLAVERFGATLTACQEMEIRVEIAAADQLMPTVIQLQTLVTALPLCPVRHSPRKASQLNRQAGTYRLAVMPGVDYVYRTKG